jgi:hypothetical protein
MPSIPQPLKDVSQTAIAYPATPTFGPAISTDLVETKAPTDAPVPDVAEDPNFNHSVLPGCIK